MKLNAIFDMLVNTVAANLCSQNIQVGCICDEKQEQQQEQTQTH